MFCDIAKMCEAAGQYNLWIVNNPLIVSHKFLASEMHHWFNFTTWLQMVMKCVRAEIYVVTEQSCLRFWIATVCSLSNCPFLSWTTTMLWGLKNGFKPWMQCPMIMSATNNMFFFWGTKWDGIVKSKTKSVSGHKGLQSRRGAQISDLLLLTE